jgi:transmembrane sensor
MGDTMKAKSSADMSIAEEAAMWVMRLEKDDGKECHREFEEWIRASPRNLQEFLLAHAVWREMDRVDPQHEIDTNTLELPEAHPADILRQDLDLARQTTSADEAPFAGSPRFRRHWVIGIAATLCALVFSWLLVNSTREESYLYQTDIGEQRPVTLNDGSVMRLNTRSRAAVTYSKRERGIEILEGEATFVVKQESRRPFRVRAGNAVVQALGTEFNVHDRGNSVRVSVVVGVVEVSAWVESGSDAPIARAILRAGEEADVIGDEIVESTQPTIKRTLAWHQRRLDFRGERLDEVAREFNRYNRVQVRVEGDTIAQKSINGVFDASNPETLLRFLEHAEGIVIERGPEEIVIRPRR